MSRCCLGSSALASRQLGLLLVTLLLLLQSYSDCLSLFAGQRASGQLHNPSQQPHIASRARARLFFKRSLSGNTRDQSQLWAREPDSLDIDYETKWFEQPVDHFTWANQDVWKQRYLVNKRHCSSANCPILFYTGNEGDIEVFTNNTGFMWENSQKLGAMLVFAEHRFYGQSMPYQIDATKIDPNETAKLGYLSSEQALADFARLIYAIKNELYDAKYSPVIVLGGSYGGMLSAWMRMKYPNLVAGALAGSAPILQFPGEYECQQFQQIVTKDYENYSPNCSKSIGQSWSSMRDFAQRNPAINLAKLSSYFNTCRQMNQADVDNLLSLLESFWVNMAMTDYANEASFLSKMPAYPIKHVCQRLNLDPDRDESDEPLLQRIALASQVYTNFTGQLACLDIEKILFDPMDVLWGFQACTEMVMPICSDGLHDMFQPEPWNLTKYVADCRIQWGVNTQPAKVQTLYGTQEAALASSNIIFSLGTRDPWSAGCPTKSNEKSEIYAIKIEGACHHEDLRPSGPADTQQVKEARRRELNIITSWIHKHYERVARTNPNDTIVWQSDF